jgi:hypothetical protein
MSKKKSEDIETVDQAPQDDDIPADVVETHEQLIEEYSDLEELDRTGLKTLAKNRDIKVLKSMSDEDIRNAIWTHDHPKQEEPQQEETPDIPDYISQMDGFDLAGFEADIIDVDQEEEYFKGVVYGDNGTGKTTFGSTMPNVLFLDCNEKGTKSAKGSGAKAKRLNGWEDIYNAYWYLKAGKHPYKSVIIDTGTNLEDMCLRYVMDKDMESDTSRDPEMATIRDYGKRAALMKPWIINFRDLPMNVLFLCQKGTANEEAPEDENEVFPAMSEKSRKCMCGAVDFIGYTYKKEKLEDDGKGKANAKTLYCLRIGPSERYLTKVRLPIGVKLEKDVLVNPTFEKVWNIMQTGSAKGGVVNE